MRPGIQEGGMPDLLFVGLTLAFFWIAARYVAACERLRRPR